MLDSHAVHVQIFNYNYYESQIHFSFFKCHFITNRGSVYFLLSLYNLLHGILLLEIFFWFLLCSLVWQKLTALFKVNCTVNWSMLNNVSLVTGSRINSTILSLMALSVMSAFNKTMFKTFSFFRILFGKLYLSKHAWVSKCIKNCKIWCILPNKSNKSCNGNPNKTEAVWL